MRSRACKRTRLTRRRARDFRIQACGLDRVGRRSPALLAQSVSALTHCGELKGESASKRALILGAASAAIREMIGLKLVEREQKIPEEAKADRRETQFRYRQAQNRRSAGESRENQEPAVRGPGTRAPTSIAAETNYESAASGWDS